MRELSPDRRQQIEDLFEDALDVPTSAREAWLDAHCAADAELRGEVAALLAGHDRTHGILEDSSVKLAVALANDLPADRRIGPYRIRREIGRGGMGVVYLAERDDGQFRQRVALKVLRDSADADELHRRFLAERQILASLSHPRIAQLLDGGVTDGQLPYLVMEYVNGVPMTTYCDERRLSVEARLQLFREVCAAVHHAHQNLVIHRDIKPSNILVTGDGHIKLLDFGIAKLLSPTLGALPVPVTRTAHRPMTPEYASPEQVRGESITTASDVYSLGVVLYELLCGSRPHRTSGGLHELARLVFEQEPERPSVRVTRDAHGSEASGDQFLDPADIAAARGTTPDRLSRHLRGDLDAIVAMALRKEPARRYGSADLLWQDLQRHLDGLPVLAHRGSREYRTRKFLARHRVQATAAAVVVASLIAGTAIAVRQAVVAQGERDRAEQSRAQAENVTSFLVGLFDVMNAPQSRTEAVTADDLVRRGAAQAEALAGSPLTQARLLEAIGRVYASMGRYTEAHDALQRSLSVRVAAVGQDDPEASVTMFHLAEVLRRLSRYPEADSMSRRALVVRRSVFGERHPAVAELLAQEAQLALYLGNDVVAESLSRHTLGIRRETLPPGDSAIGASTLQYGDILYRRGKPAEAEAVMREGIAMHRRRQGSNSPEAATLEMQLARVLLNAREDSTEAEALMRHAVSALRSSRGERHVVVAWALGDLVGLLATRGKYAEAERLAREALDIQRAAFGPDNHNVAGAIGTLAWVMTNSRRYVEAESLRREELRTLERSLGPTHSVYAGSLPAWGDALADLGRFDEAIAAHERAIALRTDLAPDHPLIGIRKTGLAAVYSRKGDYATADSLFAEARTIVLKRFPSTQFDVRRMYRLMSVHYARQGRVSEAQKYAALAKVR